MAVISEEHGFLFIQAPRTGCTAIAQGVLVPELGGTSIPEERVIDSSGNIVVGTKHATKRELIAHGIISRELADSLLTFTTVRNPFDSLVSGYLKRRDQLHDLKDDPDAWIHHRPGRLEELDFAREHSFAEWLEHKLTRKGPATLWRTRPHRSRFMHGRWMEGADVIMRFESLQADLDAVLARLGLPPHEIPHINPTRNRTDESYREHYDDRSVRLVEAVFAPDLERFGYTF